MKVTGLKTFFLALLLLVFLCFIFYMISELQGAPMKRLCEQTPLYGKPLSLKELKKPIEFRFAINFTSFGSVCYTRQCLALSKSSVIDKLPTRIPRLRHILWKSHKVSRYMTNQLETWKAIHPNWTYVLWRDSDLEKLVAKYYTGALSKFKSLREHILRVDMIRYMILHHFGGVYADLDYILRRPLDRFLKFPAVITREAEVHAFAMFGMGKYPPQLLGNPAFMMSEPGHAFLLFATMQILTRPDGDLFKFAGPIALSELIMQYAKDFPVAQNPNGFVLVPASRNFNGFERNSLFTTSDTYKGSYVRNMYNMCSGVPQTAAKELVAYCKDVSNLDPIIDPSEPMYALHDVNKSRSSYSAGGSSFFEDKQVEIQSVFPDLVMAGALL